MRDIDPTASEYITSGYIETSRPGRLAKFHDPVTAAIGTTVVGGLLGADSASKASYAQRKAAADAQAADAAAKAKLEDDIAVQRAVADKAFLKYQQGLLSYADAQKEAATAMQAVQQKIATSQLSDVSKMQEMAKFTPYGISSGVGNTFINQATGQAGVNLSPEMQKYQQGLLGVAGQQAGMLSAAQSPEMQQYQQNMMGGAARLSGNLPYAGTPEQQAYQQAMYGLSGQLTGAITPGGTPEQQAYQQAMYGKAAEQAANLNLDPAAQAQKYYQQQQDILASSRQAEDIQSRANQLQRGTLGLGVSTEAAGAGAGGMVNPQDYARSLAREQVNKQLAADAAQRAQSDIAQNLQTTQGLFGAGTSAQNQMQGVLANQLAAAGTAFGQGSAAQNQIQGALTNQANLASGMAGAGQTSQLGYQNLLGQQIQNTQGLFGAAMAPETYGMQNLKTGVDIGNITANQGLQQAQLYSQFMSPYYTSLLGAAQTGQEAALYNPQATQQGLSDAYTRQQDQLSKLLGSQGNLYTVAPTAAPTMSGVDSMQAALGNRMLNYGFNNLPSFGSSAAYPSTGIWASSTPGVSTMGGNLNRGFVTGGW